MSTVPAKTSESICVSTPFPFSHSFHGYFFSVTVWQALSSILGIQREENEAPVLLFTLLWVKTVAHK